MIVSLFTLRRTLFLLLLLLALFTGFFFARQSNYVNLYGKFSNKFYSKKSIEVTKLDNGLTVVSYKMPEKYTVGLALFVKAGSKFDFKDKYGISHFMEHFAFNGTKTRSKSDIWRQASEIGAYLNAFTSYDNVVYQIKLLKKDLLFGFDLISDIIKNSTLNQEDVDRERNVIAQEIALRSNSPEIALFISAKKKVYKGSMAENDIAGDLKSISNVTREDLLKFMDKYYFAENMVLSVTGNIDHSEAVNLARKYFSDIKSKPKKEKNDNSSGDEFIFITPKYSHSKEINFIKKDVKGVYFSLMFKGAKGRDYKKDEFRMNVAVISDILCNSGLSARIPTELRQKLGLVYNVNCNMFFFYDNDSDGVFNFSFNTSEKNVLKAYKALIQQIKIFPKTLTDEEVKKSIEKIKINILMEKENSFTLATALEKGSDFIFYNREIKIDKDLAVLEKVTKESIIKIWSEFLLIPEQLQNKEKRPLLTIYGNFNNKTQKDIILGVES